VKTGLYRLGNGMELGGPITSGPGEYGFGRISGTSSAGSGSGSQVSFSCPPSIENLSNYIPDLWRRRARTVEDLYERGRYRDG